MEKLLQWCIRNRLLIVLAMVFIVVFGIVSIPGITD